MNKLILLFCVCALLNANCTFRFIGREMYESNTFPYSEKGLSASFETTILRIANKDSAEYYPNKIFGDLVFEYSDATVGTECCQTAAIYRNGIPTGATKQVNTRSYSDFNIMLNAKIHPLSLLKFEKIRFSPYLITGLGFHKFYSQNYILGSPSSGSGYDEPVYLSKGYYKNIGLGFQYTPRKTEGFLTLNFEFRKDIDKTHNEINMNARHFSIGILVFDLALNNSSLKD